MALFNFFKLTDETRFAEAIRPHLKRLYHQAYRLTQHQDDAEDLVQELLLRLYEKKIDLNSIDKLASWLLRSLYNQFINNYRKKSRLPLDDRDSNSEEILESLALENESPHQLHENNYTNHHLQQLIRQLNPDQQALISLHDIEGHNLTELSEVMDLPLGTLKSRLHRARKTLRDQLSENKPESLEPFDDNQRYIE